MGEGLITVMLQVLLALGFCIALYITIRKFRHKKPKIARQIWIPLLISFFAGIIWPLSKYFVFNTFTGHAMLYASPGGRLLYSMVIFNLIAPLLGLISVVYFIVLVALYENKSQKTSTKIS